MNETHSQKIARKRAERMARKVPNVAAKARTAMLHRELSAGRTGYARSRADHEARAASQAEASKKLADDLENEAERAGATPTVRIAMNLTERLVAVALIRAGVLHHEKHEGSHSDIRRRLGDARPYESFPGDQEGFITSHGRFADRDAAQDVAVKCGQLSAHMGRRMLSSDVDWKGRK